MLQYTVIKNHMQNAIGTYDSFGMAVSDNGLIIKVFEDLTFIKDEIDALVDLCNNEQVELVHIDDVVENFLLYGV